MCAVAGEHFAVANAVPHASLAALPSKKPILGGCTRHWRATSAF
jgi:hypothetical protein